MRVRIFVVLAAAFAMGAALRASDDAPGWAHDAAVKPAPAYPPKVDSVMLVYNEHLTVAADGRRTTVEQGAIRVLRAARGSLGAYAPYNERRAKIREFHAWLIVPGERDFAYKPSVFVDGAVSPDQTYSEGRFRSITVDMSAAKAGTVFAWEYVVEEKSVFTFDEFTFQHHNPVLSSRYTLSLPPGWTAKGAIANHAPVEPVVAGGEYTWTVENLPWIEDEEHAPSDAQVSPRICVRFFPAADAGAMLAPLEDWAGTSRWLTGFADPSAEASAPVAAQSAKLIADAVTEHDKIARIAAYVQKVNYVSVQLNLLRGGGYTPHRAESVLERNYGDCKDKATLMRALLKAAGIDSYLVVISATDRDWVRPEWPVPQFNHAIMAARVSKDTNLPSVLDHPRLGRLLFFDPTDTDTPLGSLPIQEQGSQALVLAGERGELVTMPLLDPALNRMESEVEATLNSDGRVRVTAQRRHFGTSARYLRGMFARESADEARKYYERVLSQRLGGLELHSVLPADRPADHVLGVKLEFDALKFSQTQGRLVLVKPGLLMPGSRYVFTSDKRTLPVRLFAERRIDRVTMTVPESLQPDDVPDPIELRSRYGLYKASYTIKDGKVVVEQRLEVNDAIVPAAEYAALRDFFTQVSGYEHSAVVLTRK